MKKTLLFVLVLSGLSALSAHIIREYHHVPKLKTWPEAQSYCRDKYTDLATVVNQDESNRLWSMLRKARSTSWIGLYNDIEEWKWALGNAAFNNEFSNWNSNEPDHQHTQGACTGMTSNGLWFDDQCSAKFPAVCYNERGPAKYIFVQAEMTWENARTYCRSKYTDLVSVRNMSESNQIASLVSARAWIGLSRQPWAQWSDQTPRTFTNWMPGQPNDLGTVCGGAHRLTGKWWDAPCGFKRHFVCQTFVYHPHKTTFKLKFQSGADLNDPAVQQQMLAQLHGKLEKHGLPDFKLRWIQTDGQTFHKEQERKKEKGYG